MRLSVNLVYLLLLVATNPLAAQWDPDWVGTWKNERYIVSISPDVKATGKLWATVLPLKEESVEYEFECTTKANTCECTSNGVAEGWNIFEKPVFPKGTRIVLNLNEKTLTAREIGKLEWLHSTKDMAGDYGRSGKNGWERIHIPSSVDSATYLIHYQQGVKPKIYRIATQSYAYEGTRVTAFFINEPDWKYASFASYGGQKFYIRTKTGTFAFKSLITGKTFSNRYVSFSEDGKTTEVIEIKKKVIYGA